MKKAKEILCIVSVPVSILLALMFLGFGITFLVFTSPTFTDLIVQGINEGQITSDLPGTPEEQAVAIQAMFLVFGITFIIPVVFQIANAVISGITIKKENKALYIANIVFGLLSGVELNFIAGIFGLIDLARKPKND